MDWILSIYLFVLFVVLTPGVLLTLPPNSHYIIVALVHGAVLVVIWELSRKYLWKFLNNKKHNNIYPT